MYVNLEPCNHYGKTSPCAKLIKSKQFSRVVIAEKDQQASFRRDRLLAEKQYQS